MHQIVAAIGPAQPCFIVEDLARALGFYQTYLAFEVRYSAPVGVPFFAIVGRGSVQLHLKEVGPDIKPQPNHTRHKWAPWDVFIFAEDPDLLARSFTGRGLRLRREIEDRDDGLRGFEVQDSEGYVLFFGRPR